jgi:hypothetical protein
MGRLSDGEIERGNAAADTQIRPAHTRGETGAHATHTRLPSSQQPSSLPATHMGAGLGGGEGGAGGA